MASLDSEINTLNESIEKNSKIIKEIENAKLELKELEDNLSKFQIDIDYNKLYTNKDININNFASNPIYNIIACVRGGRKATDKVWEGAEGLEWTLSSPPPYHSFSKQPIIK